MNNNNNDNLAYKTAIDLYKFEGSLSWQIFAIYLIAHTIIISFLLEIILKSSTIFVCNYLLFITGLCGIIITVLWVACYQRNSAYHRLRLLQAKKHEPDNFEIVNGVEVEEFTEKGFASINNTKVKMEYFGKRISTKNAVRMLFILVTIFYMFIIIAYGPCFSSKKCHNENHRTNLAIKYY